MIVQQKQTINLLIRFFFNVSVHTVEVNGVQNNDGLHWLSYIVQNKHTHK